MRRMWRVLVVAAGCLLLVGAWAGWRSEASTGPATIRVTNREVDFTTVDIGRKGRSPGDVELVRQLVFKTSVTPSAIGHTEFVCTYVYGLSRVCRGTIFLPKGKLVVGGSLRYRQLYELAVLGGTGLYDNARGTLTVTRNRSNPSRDVMFFRLVG